MVMVDGSGLSPDNRITAATMAHVLLDARKQSWFPAFYNSLPEMNGMRMKSGSIRGVRSYAGYHTSRSGRQYIFVIIVNNYNDSRSEEHTSELQSLMRISYAVLCLKKNN